MRLAAFNVENLFDRAKIMQLDDWKDGKPVLDAYKRLVDLLEQATYTPAIKAKIIQLLEELELTKSDEGPYVRLRQNKGKLLKRPRNAPIEIIADGWNDWLGSLELVDAPIDADATRNTAQVIRDVDADVLAVVEAEGRTQLKDFSDQLLTVVGGTAYRHVMLIDGNDRRGIDVGLMTKDGFEIGPMFSHVDDEPNARGEGIFSRDCPEFCVVTPTGKKLWVLVNHLKSKGYGKPGESDARRKAQAVRVAAIYNALSARGEDYVAVVGDLNDTPDSDPLKPLFSTDLKDVSQLSIYEDDGRPGTYKNGTKSNKIDYVLLSPALAAKATRAGVFRKGVWGGVNGTLWPIYPEMTKATKAASDHAAIWCDLDI